MMNNHEYTKAVQHAKDNYQDVQKRGVSAIGGDALAFMDTLLTPTEKAESELQAAIIGELIEARHSQGISDDRR